MITILRSIVTWLAVSLVTLILFVIFLVPLALVTPFDRRRRFAHAIATLWGRTLRWCHLSWGISRTGFQHVRGQGPFVICANHESVVDILALFQLPANFKWISKDTNFRVPVMGWWMHAAGYIPLIRGNKESAQACMRRAAEWLRMGVSVAFFPEGTRSKDGEVQPFKMGAFKLAIEAGVPVLPVTLVGTRNLVKKGSWKVPPRVNTHFWVDPPIPVAGLGTADIEKLAERTRQVIIERKRAVTGGGNDACTPVAGNAQARSGAVS
jgi:1-acyl-sn-glycerol-3-phosphate acyltransferase